MAGHFDVGVLAGIGSASHNANIQAAGNLSVFDGQILDLTVGSVTKQADIVAVPINEQVANDTLIAIESPFEGCGRHANWRPFHAIQVNVGIQPDGLSLERVAFIHQLSQTSQLGGTVDSKFCIACIVPVDILTCAIPFSYRKAAVGSSVTISTSDRMLANNRFFIVENSLLLHFIK